MEIWTMNIISTLDKKEYSAIVRSGVLLFGAGVIALMGIISSEIFYPSGYSTSLHEISDLGSTRPPNSIIHQPSATIFNSTMIITGILISIAAWSVHSFYHKLYQLYHWDFLDSVFLEWVFSRVMSNFIMGCFR